MRFWGKIIGSQKDYFIAEGVNEGAEEGELAPDVEPRGSGVNKFQYWVTNSIDGDWTELPLITPEQIRTSRNLKYLFTGDLQKQIITNPYFNGKEAHLLKC